MRLSIALLVLVAACGGTAAVTSTDAGEAPVATTTGPVETTGAPDSPDTSDGEATTTTDSGRELAPDFTLELGAGGSYTLSEGEKPVYMVFWAEW